MAKIRIKSDPTIFCDNLFLANVAKKEKDPLHTPTIHGGDEQ